jgi:multidrug resistance protein, MATE family
VAVARRAHMAVSRRDLAELIKLAWPVVVARLGIQVMGLTDAVVVGQYSATQLGYHALAWAPTMIALVTGIGLLQGVQVMTARAVGEGKPEKAGAALRRGVIYALWIGLASSLILVFAGPLFLRSLGMKDGLAEGAIPVMLVFSLSLTPNLIYIAATNFVEGLGRPGMGAVTMWAANLANLALNLLLVPGTFGLPALGAVGAACATFGSRVVMMIILLGWITRMPGAKGFGLFKRPAPDPAAEREQRHVGYGAGASLFVEVAAFSGMNIVAGWLGGLAVAGWAVVLNVAAIVFMAPLGISAATSILVGQAYGAKDPAAVTRAGITGFIAAVVVTSASALFVGLCAPLVASAYSRDAALIAVIAPGLVLASLFFVADGVQTVGANALRARGDVVVPTVTHVASYAVVMLPLGYGLALPAGMGLMGIIWSVIWASLLSAGLLVGRFGWLSLKAAVRENP